jgi:pyruvate/2-oxoglutarate/acetoin dehydrogenase E1 component/pyruvate/2-oxoglutarate dehydrogenase complex dihydrolipoamide acyltransferase (E2) component
MIGCLNQALHEAFGRWDDLFLLGEDVTDPYGGAFKATAGLSTAYPDRVLATPLSENAIVGVANGLAMSGHRVIVEVMFGDFVGLAFDQVLNMTAKSVSMYGRANPMRVVLRCPVGGRRGYGPTHSQSLQKHLIGIPHLALYELSPFHDISAVLAGLLERDEPSVLFEDKVTYTERAFPGAGADRRYQRELLGTGNWAHLHAPDDAGRPLAVLIAPGGTGRRALQAATELSAECGLDVRVLVPARLYPVDVDDVLDLLEKADSIWVAEESTEGGTWGSEVAARVHAVAWGRLRAPVRSVSSADSVIPAAPHLEQRVILQAETIVAAVRAALAGGQSRPVSTPGGQSGPMRTPGGQSGPARTPGGPDQASPAGHPVRIPKINTNDEDYLLLAWLAAAGELVEAGQPIAEIETSKTVEELAAPDGGVLRQSVTAGAQCRPGDTIGYIGEEGSPPPPAADGTTPAGTVPQLPPAVPQLPPAVHRPPPAVLQLPALQRRVADVVSASHRDIPAAFAVARIGVDQALAAAARLAAESGAQAGLTEILIKALGRLRAGHPLLYGAAREDATPGTPAVNVGVTVDVGTGLFIPVIRDVSARSLDEVADLLTGLRMQALRNRLTAGDLDGAAIALSLTADDGIVLVQPLIPPPLTAIVSLASVQEEPWPDGNGGLAIRRFVQVGVAHDHRFVNGREAAALLAGLKALLESPEWLS